LAPSGGVAGTPWTAAGSRRRGRRSFRRARGSPVTSTPSTSSCRRWPASPRPPASRAMPPLLELRDVTKVYGGGGLLRKREPVVALDRVSFTIADDRPTITAIAGESGSGKTTLAHLLLGHIDQTAGSVRYRGRELASMGGAERLQFRREVQPIFQDPFAAFNPFYRIDHVLTTPIRRFRLASDAEQAGRLIVEALEL